MSNFPTTVTERVQALARNLEVAHSLVGDDVLQGRDENPEYLRAVTEFICEASGISTDAKEAVETLLVSISAAQEAHDAQARREPGADPATYGIGRWVEKDEGWYDAYTEDSVLLSYNGLNGVWSLSTHDEDADTYTEVASGSALHASSARQAVTQAYQAHRAVQPAK